MKRAEVQLPDTMYVQVEGLAEQLHLTVPEVFRQAAEQMLQYLPKPRFEHRCTARSCQQTAAGRRPGSRLSGGLRHL